MLIRERKETWRSTQKGKEKRERKRQGRGHTQRERGEGDIHKGEGREKKKGLWHINFIMLNYLFYIN